MVQSLGNCASLSKSNLFQSIFCKKWHCYNHCYCSLQKKNNVDEDIENLETINEGSENISSEDLNYDEENSVDSENTGID